MVMPTCDFCRRKADAAYFYPEVSECERVILTCPKHDVDCYWLYLNELDDGPSDFTDPSCKYTGRVHVAQKANGWRAIYQLDARLAQKRRLPAGIGYEEQVAVGEWARRWTA